MASQELAEGAEEEGVATTELNLAAYNGDKEQLNILLKEHGVDEPDEQGRTPLMYAAIANQVDTVEFLIKKNALITAQDFIGQTSLHLAAANNCYESLKVLVRSAADVRIQDAEGRTPLHLSSAQSNIRCLDLLIRKLRSSELNDGDNEKMTALHWCAYNNNTEGVKKLLQSGADVVVTDIEGKTALHWTANNSDDSTIKIFLEKTPTAINHKDNNERTVLHLAVAAGNVPVIVALLGAFTTHCDVSAVDKDFRTPLHWAAVLGLSQIVGILMENGADPLATDAIGATALRYAAQKDHEETVEALLSFEQTQDIPDKEGRTGLMWAAERGNYNVVKKMIERKIDVNVQDMNGATALHLAAYTGQSEICQLLIQHGAEVNVIDNNGQSPLFRACERGHSEVVLTLLQHGGRVELLDGDGRTCLHWAASGGYDFIITTLLHNGLPVNALDDGGRSALHCAAFAGSLACCTELINSDININQPDIEGVTPLHWACAGGNIPCVQLLLNAGANPNAMDATPQRLTPLDYAILEEHHDLAQSLVEQGALTISSIQELAATMIQKTIRGYLTRKKMALQEPQQPKESTDGVVSPGPSIEDKEQVSQISDVPSTAHRRKDLELQLVRAEQQAREWPLKSASSRALQSELAQKDKQRISLHREKIKAALIIQLAWRKYKRKKQLLEIEEAKRKARKQLGLDHWRQEIAALVIQLAWRQYQRRKLLHYTLRRKKILHQWTPSVLAAKQRLLVEKVYGQELKVAQYEPPKPRPMVRPAYLELVPSPAALSFNFAVYQYQHSLA